MKNNLLILFMCLLLLFAFMLPTLSFAQSTINITSKEALLMSEDGEILFEHNSAEKRPIASMTKIMTLVCIYDAIEQGKISFEDTVCVSQRAASMGGSQVFLEANQNYKVADLIKSIIVCSANDSCVAMAEHICGSVEGFVQMMNDTGRKIGLVATHFENCTGLPAVSQYSCAKDVATMFLHLLNVPHYFECASIWMEDFVHPTGRVTGMTNTNKLVRFYDGCDGGKTGFTNEAQHCLCATARRGDTRVIAVVIGACDSKTRFAEVSSLFNYAFANYQSKVFLQKGECVDSAQVSSGKKSTVEIMADEKLMIISPKGSNDLKLVCNYENKITAPIAKGQVVGQASIVDGDGRVVKSVDLVTKQAVESKTYWDYVKQIACE